MATGCDTSLQLREGMGWHQECRENETSGWEKGAELQHGVGVCCGADGEHCNLYCSL